MSCLKVDKKEVLLVCLAIIYRAVNTPYSIYYILPLRSLYQFLGRGRRVPEFGAIPIPSNQSFVLFC